MSAANPVTLPLSGYGARHVRIALAQQREGRVARRVLGTGAHADVARDWRSTGAVPR